MMLFLVSSHLNASGQLKHAAVYTCNFECVFSDPLSYFMHHFCVLCTYYYFKTCLRFWSVYWHEHGILIAWFTNKLHS